MSARGVHHLLICAATPRPGPESERMCDLGQKRLIGGSFLILDIKIRLRAGRSKREDIKRKIGRFIFNILYTAAFVIRKICGSRARGF